MYLQSSSDVMEKGFPVRARAMMKMVCHKAYAGLKRLSSVCTQKRTCQVAYAYLRSKIRIPRGITMVLAHSIERCMVYLITSKNTNGCCVVLAHGIGKS